MAQTTDADSGAQATPAAAATPGQDATDNEIVVTGIRASLDKAIDIKRNSNGVVDAISAEDIGKFPDNNLAESLQRITGVSIDRTNGEGSEVTVRGFGPSFNLVTLNGRQLPTANVATVGGDQNADYSSGTGRSFNFANLASEGVQTLEVYKTARAAVPSGGIGATINIITRHPLDATKSGLSGSVAAKALYDTSMDRRVSDRSKITPELSGFVNYTDPENRFGVALFGAYQKRNYATASATSNAWNIRTYSQFIDPANGFVKSDGTTQIENAPSDPNTLVAVPNDSRYDFSEGTRERLNGQLVMQFRPIDSLTITADGLYAQNRQTEQRGDQTNWFNRPFDQVRFDAADPVATTVFLHENINGVKDEGFEQQYRAQKNKLWDVGLNVKWDFAENMTFALDGHIGKSTSDPDNPNGNSSTLVSIGAPVVAAQSVDYSSGFPVQDITVNDAIKGNGNGAIDLGDLGSQVARTVTSSQEQRIKEIRGDFGWDLGGDTKFSAGAEYRTTRMNQARTQTQQTLGDWGILNVGDVQQYAGDLITTFCEVCKFKHFTPGTAQPLLTSFRADATKLYNALSPVYAQMGNPVNTTNQENNEVKEDTFAFYGQLEWNGAIADHDANLVIGARYADTRVTSTSLLAVPQAIVWLSDNDFTVQLSNDTQPVTQKGGYTALLPAMDFKINLTDKLVGRVSWGETLARPDYGNLFVATTVGTPPRPTANGGVASGSTGNANLQPLLSNNFDASLEWYFKPSSYLSVGFFDKRVRNFVGTGQTTEPLFGLRDPSSAQPGTLSGDAFQALRDINVDTTDVNLFTLAALYQNTGNLNTALQQFQAHYSNGALDQGFVDSTLGAYDISPNANDPLFQFAVSRPINNREAHLHGFEIAGQWFIGNTGFGVAGAYTIVRGDVGIDVGAPPSVNQFALLGLSDTASGTLIYEKYGISARLSYNWRDKYLTQTNRGGNDRNPVFVAPFGTLDMSVSYDITPSMTVSVQGVNMTNEDLRTYGRDVNDMWFAQELDARYYLGLSYRF
ncbi:TonB-dependent receptor [Stakelama marina]|uniref:TonB-dependent receptor n=1 Tax=Stakelama marina TaxID=2826939 RepID=A0A8T4IIA7_9SPHN|nr:TonB-dependent receptor [Stakelama marina]MBR0552039.1 TonB-dependent receptor [Stakelama marina]